MSTSHRSETVGQLVLVDVDTIRQQVNRAIAGFVAGYSGATLEASRLDLRQWVGWLDTAGLGEFVVERDHIEFYARWCESEGKAPATIGRRLSTICGFYNYCSQERLFDHHASARIVRRLAKRAGIHKRISPHSLRHSFITAAFDAGVPLQRCAGSSVARRSENDDALRPRTRITRPPRHLHRLHLRRWRRPLTTPSGRRTSGPRARRPARILPDLGGLSSDCDLMFWSASAMSVDVATMAETDNVHEETIVEDLVEDPVVPDADSVDRVLAGEFGATRRSGVLGQQVDRRSYPLLVLTRQLGQRLHRSTGDLNRVAAHSSPSIAFTSFHGT